LLINAGNTSVSVYLFQHLRDYQMYRTSRTRLIASKHRSTRAIEMGSITEVQTSALDSGGIILYMHKSYKKSIFAPSLESCISL